MIRIATLGAMIDHGYSLRVHCQARDCHHAAGVDLPRLAARLGREHSCLAPTLKPHFYCSRCQGSDVGFIVSPPSASRAR